MDFQQSHRYMRPTPLPPPSSMAVDPHHQSPLGPPVAPPGTWYSGHFQYQAPSQHSPSPPPPHQQWAPPPPHHSDHLPPPPPPYAAPPPYSAHPLHNQYPLPHRPHVPPPCHPYSQIPQSYPQPQDWSNVNWGHHQGWEYPAHQNEEDWAAKARAWAAAKAATDNQHSQSQFTPVSRLEEQSHYHDQYPQTVDPYYPDVVQPILPASGYQQYPAPAAPPQRPPITHPQETASISSGLFSFVPDEHLAYGARDGNLEGDSNAVFPQQESSSYLVHLQEVPSSYSSVSGKEETGDPNEKFHKSFPLPIDSSQGLHHVHPPLPAVDRPVSMEQPHYAVGNQAVEAPVDLSDQPLEFVQRFNHDRDPLMQPNYTHTDSGGPIRGVDLVAAAPSNHNWTPPAVPGSVYPSITPVLPSGQQYDPSLTAPTPVPGHSAPLFGRMPGTTFQPAIPSVGTPFGIGAGSGLHPTTGFPGDVYGLSSVADRPKKASVPNWLREEIIKKKAVIASSAPEHPKEETESIEDEAVDNSLGKVDQADSKSIDSSRSTEEEDDDEDNVEATRTAAINQEIKRILTEVLLKVTDELFDEIATQVLSEDDIIVEVEQNVVTSNHKLSLSAPVVATPNASAEVLIPTKAKGTETENDSGKFTSSSPGDVLGLASYASDEDEDDNNTAHQQPSTRKLSEDKYTVESGGSVAETEGHSKGPRNVERDTNRMVPNGATTCHVAVANELSDHRSGIGSSDSHVGSRYSSKTVSGVVEDEDNFDGVKMLESADASKQNHNVVEKVMKTEPLENIHAKQSITDDSQGRETINKQGKDDRCETKRSSTGKDFVKEVESGKDRTGERDDESRRRHDERHVKKEGTDDRNGSKEKMKEQGGKFGEKAKESDSRKRSTHSDVKEDRKEKERDRRANAKEDGDRRRDRTKDEKGERSRHKLASESSRHKRRHSSSVGSRGRSSKDNSVVSHGYDSNDESSDDSQRKQHSKRRNLSPLPNRSRRRQDSRSPHSKHSQRRHSPYSSLESTRGRRSRSRSPVRR